MASPRRYTKAQRAKAAGIATLTSIAVASEQTGIPESTLRYWMDKPEFAELRAKTRDGVADEFWATIQVGVQRIAALIPSATELRDVATAVGILYDKHALLTGGATGRTESRDLTGTISDAELSAAIREAESIATGEGSPAPAEGAPEA